MTTLIVLAIMIAIAPLVSGVITKIKNNFRMRRGRSILQPYYDLAKLFNKGEVVAAASSWVFRIAPFIVLASALAAAFIVAPLCMASGSALRTGDLFTLIFVFALGRFFLTLAGIDTGSAFGGMGSSREVFIAALAEPAACLAFFAVALRYGTSALGAMGGTHLFSATSLIAALALFLVMLAETARIPVDNQETHLELTMVHEAMLLEYSGRPLALLSLAAYLKQLVWYLLIAALIAPPGVLRIAAFGAIAVVTASIEVAVAKMRLFRVADFLAFAFAAALIAAACAASGV